MELDIKAKPPPCRGNRSDISVLEQSRYGNCKKTGAERCPFLFLRKGCFVIRVFVVERETDICIGRFGACMYRFGNSLRNTGYNRERYRYICLLRALIYPFRNAADTVAVPLQFPF